MDYAEKWYEKWWEKRGYEPGLSIEDMIRVYEAEFLRDWLRNFKED